MNRLEFISFMAPRMGDGWEGTTTAAGSTTTTVDTSLLIQSNDFWNKSIIVATGGTPKGEWKPISDFDSSTGTLTHTAFSAAIGSGNTYVVLRYNTYQGYIRSIRSAHEYAGSRNRNLQPWFAIDQTFEQDTWEYNIPFRKRVTGTADTGSSTTLLTDSALTEANDFWIGARLVITAGPNVGEVRTITDSSSSATTVTVDHAYSTALTTSSQFELIRFLPLWISRIEYQYDDSPLDWRIVSPHMYEVGPGTYPVLTFNHPGGARRRVDVVSLYPHSHAGEGAPRPVFSVNSWVDKPMRMQGLRAPEWPQTDYSPIEISLGYLEAWVEFRLARGLSLRRDLDTMDNRGIAMEARQEAEALLATDPSIPPGSKRVF